MELDEKPSNTKAVSIQVASVKDENPDRGNWSGQLDFLLSCIGYAVGLGNVWRFPYLCFKHGGGAFLIPYLIMLLIIGIPCFLLEMTIGQYSGMGPAVAYSNLSPLFKGLGLSNIIASSIVALYYNMIIAWTIYYLFASFTSHLPWDRCDNDFNTEFCFNTNSYENCTKWRSKLKNDNIIYHNGTCLYKKDDLDKIRSNLSHFYGCTRMIPNYVDDNDKCRGVESYTEQPGIYINARDCVDKSEASNIMKLFDIPYKIRVTASQEYFEKSVLHKTEGLNDMGNMEWHLVLCLMAAWIVLFGCLIKGIKSSGKVVYFTATFPYLVLLILLIRAVTLPGAFEGIKFYMVPDWSKLSDIKVWVEAAVQIFFSTSISSGGLITLASYNRFHNNILRDTMIVCFGNCLTSFFAGFVIFSVLGFLANDLGVKVHEVAASGTGLAFITYPDLVTRLPVGQLWSFLFFFMLFTLGLDSEFAVVEMLVTGILDYAPNLRSKQPFVVGGICLLAFICGLPLATGGGSYLLDLLDHYGAGWPFLFIGLVELIIVSYVYGFHNYLADIQHMVNFNPGMWLKSHLLFIYMTIAPLLILVLLIFSWASYEPFKSGTYVYPEWANGIGLTISIGGIVCTPAVAIAQIINTYFFKYSNAYGFRERIMETFEDLLNPTPQWRENANRAVERDARQHGLVNVGLTHNET